MTDQNTPMSTESNDDLRERVAQLEEQQEHHDELLQEATDPDGRSWSASELMTEMGLSRRQALTAVAALAGGATLGGAIRESIQPAAADASTSDGDGDVGLPGNRIDVFADGVDANEVSADESYIGLSPSERPEISNVDNTLYVDPVGGDDSNDGTDSTAPLATIQEAVERVPIYLRHKWTIDLTTAPTLPVTYDEDVLVPPVVGHGQAEQESGAPQAGPVGNLDIQGDENTPSNVEIGSITFASVIGVVAASLKGATILRDNPYDNENYGFASYGPGEVRAFEVRFAPNVTNGILAYGSKMKVSLVDFGSSNLTRGIKAKRHGSLVARDVSGLTTGETYFASEGSKIVSVDNNTATGSPTHDTNRGGIVYDQSAGAWYGLGGVGEPFDLLGNSLLGVATIRGDTDKDVVHRLDEDRLFTVQAFDSTAGDFLDVFSADAGSGDLLVHKDGNGLRVTTPDGTAQYRIRVDNNGNVVSDQV